MRQILVIASSKIFRNAIFGEFSPVDTISGFTYMILGFVFRYIFPKRHFRRILTVFLFQVASLETDIGYCKSKQFPKCHFRQTFSIRQNIRFCWQYIGISLIKLIYMKCFRNAFSGENSFFASIPASLTSQWGISFSTVILNGSEGPIQFI